MTKYKSKYQKKVIHEQLCRRCGFCCHDLDANAQPIPDKYCPFLTFDKEKKATCTIYPTRVGTKTGPHTECQDLTNTLYLAPDCPYRKVMQ